MNEWKAFLDHFSVRTLALESANLSQVMLWYEEQQSPFGPKKKKEFPDALAFSSLLACAREHHATIAVIAADPDFRLACKRFSEVLHFPSLPAFTEALIAGDIHVKKMRHIFEADSSLLSAAVETEISTLHFFPAADPDDGRAEGVKALEVAFDEFHVVAVGDEECMIAFDAAVRYSILVAFDDPDSAIVDSSEGIFHKHRRFSGIVEDQASLSGTAKIKLSKDWSAFEEVTYFEFSGQEVEVTETPPEEWPFDEPY
jgi:hypothetical protein